MSGLRRIDLERVLRSLIADELGRARQRAVGPQDYGRWTAETTIDEDGIGLDSLDKLAVIARVTEFFHLHEVGSEDYLVIARTLGEWAEIVEESLRLRALSLSFRTSGSTGDPKPITHAWASLQEELDAFAPLIGQPARVIAWTPPHHVYGFLFSALLPARMDVEVLDGRLMAPSALRRCAADDLLVATPFVWRRLFAAAGEATPPALGLVSGAACPAEVWDAAAPLRRLIEIYGSTETAGVGWRDAGDAPFQFLRPWRRSDEDKDGDALQRRGEPPMPAPDHLAFDADGRFRPLRRRDTVVQVAGVNVSIAETEAILAEHPAVAEVAVRPDASDPDRRLKAFIVPVSGVPAPGLDAAIAQFAAEHLSAPARPQRVTLGRELPTTETGKRADWPV